MRLLSGREPPHNDAVAAVKAKACTLLSTTAPSYYQYSKKNSIIMPPKKKNYNQQSEVAELPRFKSPLLLRLTADMFRQHSDLYLKQAAVLERIASSPNNPESWMIQEDTPEVISQQIQQQATTTLACKSYQGMLQVQKRVDHMERLMTRNGMSRKA